jgi:UDP-GlcNAc:undecaprenyl-phosphate GlcNAc-1-phosphate transferase
VYLIGPAAASFSLCLLAMFALRPIAIALDLIDRPGGRKTHTGDVPVVGGLAMLLGIILGMGLVPLPDLPDATTSTLLAACAILVTVGLIDDRFDLSPWTRLPAQLAAAVLLMIGTKSVVLTLGAPFGGSGILLDGWLSYAVTILATIAAINAFNMLDGMDGLAGAMAMVALAALALLSYEAGLIAALSASVVFIGAVSAFLLSNVPIGFNHELRCFMGDSGSTLLGFSVAWLCIKVSQSPLQAAEPVTMLWIVALPLYELVWTVIRRAIRGISPFRPDTEHLHHLLRKAGFGVRGAFVVFVLLAILLAAFGVTIDKLGMSDAWSFSLLTIAGAIVVRLMYRADYIWKVVPASLRPAAIVPD